MQGPNGLRTMLRLRDSAVLGDEKKYIGEKS